MLGGFQPGPDNFFKIPCRQLGCQDVPIVFVFVAVLVGVRPCFHGFDKLQCVNLVEYFPQHSGNVGIQEIVVHSRQERDNLERVMPDLVQLVTVFVVAGVVALGVVYVLLQLGFHLRPL